MARFRYRMQSVLNIKLKMETQAKQAFAMAKAKLDEEQDKLELLRQRKEAYEEESRRLLQDTLKVREILDAKSAILRMDEYLKEQERQVALAEAEVEKARDNLKEVMIERKTQETLRDKAFNEYMQEENRAESKQIDQLTSYTYGQKMSRKQREDRERKNA